MLFRIGFCFKCDNSSFKTFVLIYSKISSATYNLIRSQKYFPSHSSATLNSAGFCIRLNGTKQEFTPLTFYPKEGELVW